MQPLRKVHGPVAPLYRADVDTDQIIPKQFLKSVERSGYGKQLFFDWRYAPDGTPKPDFVLNRPEYAGAAILVGGRNFGCGSSREHAAWALLDFGIRVVIAPSFADIFRSNCYRNGVLPLELPEDVVEAMANRAEREPGYALTMDLEECRITDGRGVDVTFEIDAFQRRCLLEGLDDIGLTLLNEDRIAAYEAATTTRFRPSSLAR